MSELISGKEALIALLSGKEVQMLYDEENWDEIESWEFWKITDFTNMNYKFRLKPHTITINGIEVPAPFEPKLDDVVYYLTTTKNEGYTWGHFHPSDAQMTQFGAWRTKEEIKQVVAALRQVFGGSHDN